MKDEENEEGNASRSESESIGGLNVGVIRCGAWYGRRTWDEEVLPRVVAGHVYKYL